MNKWKERSELVATIIFINFLRFRHTKFPHFWAQSTQKIKLKMQRERNERNNETSKKNAVVQADDVMAGANISFE